MLEAEVEELSAALVHAGHPRETLRITHTAGIRYSGQSYETPIVDAALHDPKALGEQFDAAHRALYGYSTGEAWELVTIRTEVSGAERANEPDHLVARNDAEADPVTRQVTFESGEKFDVKVLSRDSLPVDVVMAGPLIIEDEWSTVIVPPSDTICLDAIGNLHMEVEVLQ